MVCWMDQCRLQAANRQLEVGCDSSLAALAVYHWLSTACLSLSVTVYHHSTACHRLAQSPQAATPLAFIHCLYMITPNNANPAMC